MNNIPSFIFGGGAPARTPQEAARNRAVYEALVSRMSAPRDVGEGLQSVGNALVARSMMDRASAGEEAGQARVAELMGGLQDGADMNELMGVLSDPWAADNPGMSAVAQALMQRELKKGDPSWQTFESGGDVFRWNENDPNSTPSMFFDGPAPVPDPYTLGEGQMRFDGTNQMVAQGPPKSTDPLVQINNGGADEEFYKAAAGARGKAFVELETAGVQAQSNIGQINRLEQLLATAPQGIEGAWKQMAGEFGIASDGLNDIQAATALINKLVPEQRAPGSGPMSDKDVELFKQSMPRIINQPGGNAVIIQTLKGIAVYEQQVGDIASRVLNKEMTPAEGRAAMAALENPLELFSATGGVVTDGSSAPAGVDPEDWAVMTPEQRALWN